MILKTKDFMSKSIRISDENYKKLQRLGKGSYDEKFSLLLQEQQQKLVDQSKPEPDTSTAPPNDLFVGLILCWIIESNRFGELLIAEGLGLIDSETKDEFTEDETSDDEDTRTRRKDIISYTRRRLLENGWAEQYPIFFEDSHKRNSKFEKKVDNALGLLVRNNIIEMVEEDYKSDFILEASIKTREKISALKYLPYYSTVPKIYYKESQRIERFKYGIAVPHIHLFE